MALCESARKQQAEGVPGGGAAFGESQRRTSELSRLLASARTNERSSFVALPEEFAVRVVAIGSLRLLTSARTVERCQEVTWANP